MKIENGKIVEATENELFSLYLDREMDNIMDFNEYRHRMENAGCVVGNYKNVDGNCSGCRWWGVRPQRCSCCRRNPNMKDNYEVDT